MGLELGVGVGVGVRVRGRANGRAYVAFQGGDGLGSGLEETTRAYVAFQGGGVDEGVRLAAGDDDDEVGHDEEAYQRT